MVGVAWHYVIRNGSAPGGDMLGHAAAAEWLRTLPWWDWRGWSDWFYGGQAIGVNYPPLGHAWMRFTDPVHGQMAAVAIGLLVLLPWGTLRLARAVGYTSSGSADRGRGSALLLAAASGHMHWVLSGFHAADTFFGSWPAMLATVIGLFTASYAAQCRRPATAGLILGVAALFNSTVIPGVVVVGAVLLIQSGASFRTALRWWATAASAAVAVSAWWLVPFVAGWERLVRWDVPLSSSLSAGSPWQQAILATVGVFAARAALKGSVASRRLAGAALAGLTATSGRRPLRLPAPRALARDAHSDRSRCRMWCCGEPRTARDCRACALRGRWQGAALLIVFTVVTVRLEIVPLAVGLLWRPGRDWVTATMLSWAAMLLFVPIGDLLPDSRTTRSGAGRPVGGGCCPAQASIKKDSCMPKPSTATNWGEVQQVSVGRSLAGDGRD